MEYNGNTRLLITVVVCSSFAMEQGVGPPRRWTSVASSSWNRCLLVLSVYHMRKEDEVGQSEPFDLLPQVTVAVYESTL
jgi:hypothetical protein